ncbi:MAG: hypothetical protein AB1724_11250 [Thermodesulfobacteriota bacterium]
MSRRSILSVLMFALILVRLQGGAAPPVAPEPAGKEALYGPAVQVGTIVDPEIAEASGLAASRRDDNLLWVINDSGNPAALFAITPNGRILGKFILAGTPNDDWEDLASFTLDQIPYLLIADTGDNMAGRTHFALYVVEEPEVMEGLQVQEGTLPVKWRIQFAYPDGPRDCEAAAVDVPRKRVLLLSKHSRSPVLYELPLLPDAAEVKATVIGPASIPRPTPEDVRQPYGFSWSRPTAMDLSTDGSRLVILTYKHAYAFVKPPEQSWRSAIAAPGVTVPLPHPGVGLLPIREGLCIQPSTGDLFVAGESPPAPVFRLKRLAVH